MKRIAAVLTFLLCLTISQGWQPNNTTTLSTAAALAIVSDSADGVRAYADTTTHSKASGRTLANQRCGSCTVDTTITVPDTSGIVSGSTVVRSSGVELNYNHNTRANRLTSPTRLLAFTTTIQVVNTNGTVFTLAGPGIAGHVEKIVVAPGATLPADAGGVTLAFTKTGGTLQTAASTVDLTSGGQTASTAHAEALSATAANNDIAATNVVIATLATDGTVTTAGSPILITVWYSVDNP